MTQARLQKWIADSGKLSRRKAESAILEGRVVLNGQVVRELGTTADLSVDVLELDGERVLPLENKKTVVFYKPRGILTTKSDDRGRRTVMEFFAEDPSLNPVGRLDFESEGLLLMTQDGDLLLKLTHPRYGFQKKYQVWIRPGVLRPEQRQLLLNGVELEDGVGRFEACTEAADYFEVTVSEGRNRFIRRMFAAVDCEVTRLKRIQMGPVEIGDLKPGERRSLTPDELQKITEHLKGLSDHA